jgi:hypothetical protein
VRFAAAVLCVAPSLLRAQQTEIRVDVLGPPPVSVQPAFAYTVFAGYYARISAIAGYSVKERSDLVADRWRGDVIARFLLDPFRQQRWALSIGAGLSVRRHTYLAAVLDLEGPETRGFLPAVQVGLSGGVRGAVLLRRAVPQRR